MDRVANIGGRAMLGAVLLVAVTAITLPHAVAAEGATERDGPVIETVPRAPSEGGPRRWQAAADGGVALREAPSIGSPVVETVDDGTVLSNLGCETGAEHVWCKVGTLRGKARGYAAAERLRPAAGPDGTVPRGVDDSARRAKRGDFDAHGSMPCAQERGQRMGECEASVARGGGGDAAVVVRFPNGFGRSLYFTHGEFVAANATMSGSGSDTDWRKEGGRHLIRVDDQRYDVPDDFVLGR